MSVCIAAWASYRKRNQPSRLFAALSVVQFALLLDMVFNWRWKLHAYGMQEAMLEGVYWERRSPQLVVLAILASLVGCGAVVVLCRLRYRPGAAIAMIGTLMSCGMWAGEAISYHYLDLILYYRVEGVMFVSLIWVSLTLITCFGVWKDRRSLLSHSAL